MDGEIYYIQNVNVYEAVGLPYSLLFWLNISI